MKYKLNDPKVAGNGKVFVIKELEKYGQVLYGLFEIVGGQHKELHTFYEKRFVDLKMDKYLYGGLEKC